MVKPPKGYRHRTRKVFKKSVRERGAVPPISRVLVEYKAGDLVHIKVNPAIVKGMPHRRYHGKTGRVIGKRGKAYLIELSVGSKKKTLIIRPEHLTPATTS